MPFRFWLIRGERDFPFLEGIPSESLRDGRQAWTRAAALGCRYFEPGTLPDALTVATLPIFHHTYAAAEAVDLPTEPPSDAVAIASVNSELVGPNKDVALNVHAGAEGIDLNFIVIGQFDDSGGHPGWICFEGRSRPANSRDGHAGPTPLAG